jgi:hypothetical protein
VEGSKQNFRERYHHGLEGVREELVVGDCERSLEILEKLELRNKKNLL